MASLAWWYARVLGFLADEYYHARRPGQPVKRDFGQKKTRRSSPGFFLNDQQRVQLFLVFVTLTVWPQNEPVIVSVWVEGSNDDVMSTSHVPDPPVRAQVKLPL